jgi:hypothetical protein
MEVECIEPDLYLNLSEGALQRFTKAIVNWYINSYSIVFSKNRLQNTPLLINKTKKTLLILITLFLGIVSQAQTQFEWKKQSSNGFEYKYLMILLKRDFIP